MRSSASSALANVDVDTTAGAAAASADSFVDATLAAAVIPRVPRVLSATRRPRATRDVTVGALARVARAPRAFARVDIARARARRHRSRRASFARACGARVVRRPPSVVRRPVRRVARAPHRSSHDRPRALAMGKRKSSKPPPKKVAPKVDTTFTCPFCNHDKSVFARLDHVAEKGLVECGTCGQKYTCNITHLSEPIDVYSDWIDACERINAKDEDESEEED
jgi:transcription elongation factor Elf1